MGTSESIEGQSNMKNYDYYFNNNRFCHISRKLYTNQYKRGYLWGYYIIDPIKGVAPSKQSVVDIPMDAKSVEEREIGRLHTTIQQNMEMAF